MAGEFKKIHSERQIQYDHGNGRVPIVKLNWALKYKQSRSLLWGKTILSPLLLKSDGSCDHGRGASISSSSSVEVSKQSGE
jgi:hypothetical protein